MTAAPIWKDRNGTPIACLEKLRLLDENVHELTQTMRDAWDDALLMGVDPDAMRAVLTAMIADLKEDPSP